MAVRRFFLWLLVGGLVIAVSLTAAPLIARGENGICSITNRTAKVVQLTILRDEALPEQRSLAVGKKFQLSTVNRPVVRIRDGGAKSLDANMNYEIRDDGEGKLLWHTIGKRIKRKPSKLPVRSGESPNAGALSPAKSGQGSRSKTEKMAIIPVKLLVDDEEPALRKLWEQRLRDRIDSASEILAAHCGVRLKVVAVERWDSDDQTTDFVRSLREFEYEVDEGPARLAIGFTSQFAVTKGRTNLGGTRGPLHSHILIREWSQVISEPERLEVLLHELGHYLGAPHSGAKDSVMRPVLGDRKSRAADFAIRFDETNRTIMNLIAGEIRSRRVRKLSDVSATTRAKLRTHYVDIAKKNPKDPAARRFVYLIDQAATATPQR